MKAALPTAADAAAFLSFDGRLKRVALEARWPALQEPAARPFE